MTVVLAVGVMGSASALAGEPSKTQYIAKADAICTTEGKLIAPYARKYSQMTSGKHPNYSGAALALSGANAVRSASLVKLRALPQPTGARSKLSALWETFDKLITDTDEVAVALGGGDNASVAYFDADAQLTGGNYELQAQAFGFKVCGAQNG